MRTAIEFFCFIVTTSFICGCTTVRETTPARTATEQLLLSTATQNATEDRYFAWLTGKKVFIEDKYFDSYDKGNAISAIRERIAASGAFLVSTQGTADFIIEIRSAALSMNNSSTLVGIPAMTVPIPLAGPVTTPEISLYKDSISDSIARFALYAYERESGKYVESAGPMVGKGYLHIYKVLFISWKRSDVPELSKAKKHKD